MEPARSTETFNRKITVADANNIIGILDMNTINSKYQIFGQDYLVSFQTVLEDLKLTVNLLGLAEAPWPEINALMSEAEKMAEIARIRTQGQKIGLGLYTAKGNGPWQYESEVVLQNQGGSEIFVPILVPFLSSNETLLISGDFKLGVRIEPKWNQPLKANDYLVIKGTWRQVVSFSKKKDDDLDALNARIEALESLLAVFGASTSALPGSNGLVPAPPPNGENRLLRGDRTWQDPSSFIPSTNSGLYGSASIPSTTKNGWSGIFFTGGGNKNYLMQNASGEIGLYNSEVPRWNFYATNTLAMISLPLQINNGTTIKKVLSLQTIISLPNIPSLSPQQIDVALTGVAIGGFVTISPTINPVSNGFWTFYCHAQILTPNVVSLFFKNDWTTALDLPDFWIRILYIEF